MSSHRWDQVPPTTAQPYSGWIHPNGAARAATASRATAEWVRVR